MKTDVRLLKVVVQPVFVVDDGENLHEVEVQPIKLTAQQWPSFSKLGIEEAKRLVEESLKSQSTRNAQGDDIQSG